MRVSRFAAALVALLLALPAISQAATLTTAPPNNGSGGVFLTLTPAGSALTVTSFDVPFSSAAGSAVQVEVWTRPGTYAGFTASNVGWTLSETANATSAGTTTFAPISLTNPLSLGAAQATSVYLHAITVGGGIRYTGTAAAPPQTTWSNADLTLFSDTTRTGNVSFAGTQFVPRTFSGNVNYNVVPEPSTALGLSGLVGLALRRRRK